MKKKLLLLAMSLFALVGNMTAKSDIYFKVDQVDIMQGKSAAITFYYDADADEIFKGFQVEFFLPDGFELGTGHKLGAELAAHNPELQLRYNPKPVGETKPKIVFLGFQIDTTLFPVGEGIELFTCFIKCDESVPVGPYNLLIDYLEFADMKTGQSFLCPEKNITLNVIEYAPREINEEDTEIAEDSTEPEEILVKRNIKANTWSTLTLPFDLSGEQVAEIFGDDVEIAEFIDYTSEMVTKQKTWEEAGHTIATEDVRVQQWTLNFYSSNPADGIYANYPILIKTSKDISEFLVQNAVVSADEEGAIVNYDSGRPKYTVFATMHGTLHNGITIPASGIYLSGNNFCVSGGSTKIKGLRAYFTIEDFSFNPGDSRQEIWSDEQYDEFMKDQGANICFSIDGEATAIEGVTVNGREIVNGDVYSVNGTYMGRAENVMKSLPSGIYIVNNKKVVVK